MSVKNTCGLILIAAVFSMLSVDVAFAQRGGSNRTAGMMRMMGGNNQFGLLTDKKVQEELELVDDQIEELEDLQKEAMQEIRDMFSEMQDSGGDRREAFRNIREKMQERMKPYEERVNDVLLPHQQTRLKQLGYQSSGRFSGAGGVFDNQALLDDLDISDKQRDELKEAVEKAREKLQKEYQKLVKDAEDDILKVLDSDQRKKFKELVGDSFQFDNAWQRRGSSRERTDRSRRR
ncbi:MAG: hypothetical protein GY819_01575 [Planctomycetaceae bacterium]|nr:hypothetical protein [Planctomycetaceae bacterium]MCP4461469.1 hypothetical protein [Planctomycetaceae bacterium]